MTTKSIPELSVDAQVLIRLLEAVTVGEVIEYSALNESIGANVQHTKRHLLYTACRHLLNERQMVFACVSGKGVKRLTDSEVSGLGVEATSRIRRISRRTMKRMATAKRGNLSKDERLQLDGSVTLLAFIQHTTSAPAQKQIAASVGDGALPLAKTLALFQSK